MAGLSTVTSLAGVGVAAIGALNLVTFSPTRGIQPGVPPDGGAAGPFIQAMCTIEEEHTDDLGITEQPVSQGAVITDHAYKLPPKVTLRAGWSNSPNNGTPLSGLQASGSLFEPNGSVAFTQQVYLQLKALQLSRVPFTLYTGKDVYPNMLMASISTRTDADTENALIVTMRCQQITIATLQSTIVPASATAQAMPEATQATNNTGANAVAGATPQQESIGAMIFGPAT